MRFGMNNQKAPSSISEYLDTYKELGTVISWIRKEMISNESALLLAKMIVLSFIVILFQLVSQLTLGHIFSSFTKHEGWGIVFGIAGTALCLELQKYFDRKKAKAREWIMSIHWANLDRRVLELFFEKSAGQHMREDMLSVSAINKGRMNLRGMESVLLFEAIPTLTTLIVSILLLLWLSPVVALIMVTSIVGYIACSIYLNFHVMRVCTPIDKTWRKIGRRQSDRMEKAMRVIVSSQENREVSEIMKEFDDTIVKDRNFWCWFIDTSQWRNHSNVTFYTFALCYCSYMAWSDNISDVGFLIPLFGWSKSVIDTIWSLGDSEQKLHWFMPSIMHMIKALSLQTDVPEIESAQNIFTTEPQRIVFDNVSFSYPAREKNEHETEDDEIEEKIEEEEVGLHTLSNVSFTIEAGEKVAILGPSGAGKTTLMRLVMRFMDPTSGLISVGGVDLRSAQKASWMKSIGYIAQNPEVFDWTVRQNLTYRLTVEERERITDEEVWGLMRLLQIDFGKRLHKGLDTKVGKHGLKLSGGQAQRLMIGAAVIGRPWFMVIDEATSSLDSTTERKVQAGLAASLSLNTSALIVAHRLSTVRELCTKFVVLRPTAEMQKGESQIEAIGSSFEELYQISPTFRQLADDQGVKI
jgi:ABC-type multidrug transport system fused ATPase/permease subunit